MIAIACVPLLVSVVLWLAGPRLGRHLPARAATVLLTVAALAAALATGLVLAAAGFLVLATDPRLAAAAHLSAAALRAADPVPAAVGLVAGVTVLVLLVASSVRAIRAISELTSAALACRRLGPAPGGLVVVDDARPAAYTVPGLSGRMVVTTSMLRALPPEERRALLAHEAAHLDHHHVVYVQLASLAAAANPLLRPTAGAVRVAAERWADDVAAQRTGDRRLVATALARAGLARAGDPTRMPAAALAAVDTALGQRIEALLAPQRQHRTVTVATVVLMTVGCVVSGTVIGRAAHDAVELAQSVYAQTR
ncbi:MAG: M56 family metallopeptidase [bacterium]